MVEVGNNPDANASAGAGTRTDAEDYHGDTAGADGVIQDAINVSGDLQSLVSGGYVDLQSNIMKAANDMREFGLSVGDGFIGDASDSVVTDEQQRETYLNAKHDQMPDPGPPPRSAPTPPENVPYNHSGPERRY